MSAWKFQLLNIEACQGKPTSQDTPPSLRSEITAKERLDYAWKHFSLISDQRVKTFNLYVIVLGAAITATITLSGDGKTPPNVFKLVGAAHIVIASIFWTLDWRACEILEVSKKALREIEQSSSFSGFSKLIVEDDDRKRGKINVVSYRCMFFLACGIHAAFGVVALVRPEWLGINFSAGIIYR